MRFSIAITFLLGFCRHHQNNQDVFVSGYSSSAFVPRSIQLSSFVPKSSSSVRTTSLQNQMTMLVETSGGMEELAELTERIEKPAMLSKQARKSPGLFKLAGIATIPVSAALGFGLVPVRQIAFQTIGALITGIAGAVGKSRLDALTEANAKPALAQALIDNGLSNIQQVKLAVNNVKEQFGINDDDFIILCIEIYSSYLIGMVKYLPTAKTTELKELDNVKQALGLDNLQLGEAHCMAAKEWYRTTCLFTPEEELEDPKHPDRLAMDKFLFLTERALRQADETDEAFKFEMTRIAKAFNLDYNIALERIAETVEPFYQRALKSTRSKLNTDQVSSDMLERARRTLGITDKIAFDMHVACFNAEVRSLLGLPEKKELNADDDENDDEDEEDMEDEIDFSAAKFTDDDAERVSEKRGFCVSICCLIQLFD